MYYRNFRRENAERGGLSLYREGDQRLLRERKRDIEKGGRRRRRCRRLRVVTRQCSFRSSIVFLPLFFLPSSPLEPLHPLLASRCVEALAASTVLVLVPAKGCRLVLPIPPHILVPHPFL